jgi:hypothetical protein
MIVACLFGYDERSMPKIEVTGVNGRAMTLADVIAQAARQ